MKHYYHVFIGSKHIDLVQAFTGEHAVQIVESKFGSAKKYSNNDSYRAVRA
jgi:hypothetical protein